jgi:Fe-S oxidoreductase
MAHEALDLCLECKACKAECPSAVDMAKLKYEFLNYYYQKRARPLRDYGFAFINKWIQISRPFLGTLNYLSANRIIKTALEGLFGISQHRQLPKFTSGDDHALFQKGDFTYKEEVIFISDPLTEYVNPHVKSAGLRVINTCGGKVHSLPMIGAGRTMISKGFLPQAKEHAKSVVRAITDIDPDGAFPIIGLEPSEVVCFQDEYLDFFPGDEIVREIAKRTFSIEEFLLRSRDGGHPRYDSLNISVDNHSLLLHGHCYQKSQPQADDGNEIGTQATVTLFNKLGCQVEVIDAGCCGMSGSFGYEADHYNLSMKIGEERLFPAIQKKGLEQTIVAPGGSCRAHIKDGTGESASHPVEVLAELMSLN